MKQETVEERIAIAPRRKTMPPVLRRCLRTMLWRFLLCSVAPAIWEALGWGLGLQWLPPFSSDEALAQFVQSGSFLPYEPACRRS